MTVSELRFAFVNANIPPTRVTLRSIDYSQLSPGFVIEASLAAVDSLPAELRTMVEVGGKFIPAPRYVDEVFNCIKLCRFLSVYVDLCSAVDEMRTGIKRKSPAFGTLAYFRGGDPVKGHAICWFCDHDGKIRFFEWQTQSEVILSPEETATAYPEAA